VSRSTHRIEFVLQERPSGRAVAVRSEHHGRTPWKVPVSLDCAQSSAPPPFRPQGLAGRGYALEEAKSGDFVLFQPLSNLIFWLRFFLAAHVCLGLFAGAGWCILLQSGVAAGGDSTAQATGRLERREGECLKMAHVCDQRSQSGDRVPAPTAKTSLPAALIPFKYGMARQAQGRLARPAITDAGRRH